jgi:hypothetical protein
VVQGLLKKPSNQKTKQKSCTNNFFEQGEIAE